MFKKKFPPGLGIKYSLAFYLKKILLFRIESKTGEKREKGWMRGLVHIGGDFWRGEGVAVKF